MAKKLNYEGGVKATEIGKEKPQAPANFTDTDANAIATFFGLKADLQLKEGVDWTADGSSDKATLFSLLATNDFVNIVATNGASIIGKVMELGADATAPIKVQGFYVEGASFRIGVIQLTPQGATYTVQVDTKFYNKDEVDNELAKKLGLPTTDGTFFIKKQGNSYTFELKPNEDVAALLSKVIYKQGQAVPFSTTFVPNTTLWDKAPMNDGMTIIQGTSEGIGQSLYGQGTANGLKKTWYVAKKDITFGMLSETPYTIPNVPQLQDGKYVLVVSGNSTTWEDIQSAFVDEINNLKNQVVAKSSVKYYTGEIKIFNVEQVAPSKFADTTLFDKYELPLGATLLGGSGGTLTNGEVISHSHSLFTSTGTGFTRAVVGGGRPSVNGLGFLANDDGGEDFTSKGYLDNSPKTTNKLVKETGGTQNKAYGLQIISHIYVAKKDITFAEMGE